jgi:type I restriction enzyme, S subunit
LAPARNRTPKQPKLERRERFPQGWVKTTLGELVRPSRERALPSEISDTPYVGLEHIEPQTMRLLGHGDPLDSRSSSLRFSKGDVLYGRMRPYLNKVWVAEFDGICSAEFLVFGQPEVDSQFLALRLNAEDFVTFANGEISGERPRVDFERLAVFPILLPPVPEQKRIVAKLRAALSEVEQAEKATTRAQERLKRYRTAVLEDAVSGELTEKWRTGHRNKAVKLQSGEMLLQQLLASRRAIWEETELKRLRLSGKDPRSDKWKARYIEPSSPTISGLPKIPRTWTWATVEQIATSIATGATPYRGNPAYWDGG